MGYRLHQSGHPSDLALREESKKSEVGAGEWVSKRRTMKFGDDPVSHVSVQTPRARELRSLRGQEPTILHPPLILTDSSAIRTLFSCR